MTSMDKNFIKQEFLGIFPKKCPYYAVTVLKLRNGKLKLLWSMNFTFWCFGIVYIEIRYAGQLVGGKKRCLMLLNQRSTPIFSLRFLVK